MHGAAPEELDAKAQLLVDECVGDNLDQLSTIDMRGDEVVRVLYRAARDRHGASLTLSAARLLWDRVGTGDRVLMLTGFLSPKPYPETDGLIGSAVLAAALERARGAVPVFVCEPEVAGPLMAALRASGLNPLARLDGAEKAPHPAVVLEFPSDRGIAESAAAALAKSIRPVACVAVERPGANPVGEYHFAMGKNASSDIALIDILYRAVAARGAATVAVGDFGNELGMGAIYETIRAETPAGAECACGCGGGTACATPADVTVIASVSDWGAYAISACLSYLAQDPAVLIPGDVYRRILDDTVRAGAIDGPTRYAAPFIDGIDDGFNTALLEVMRGAVRYPGRPTTHSAIRLFRARRREPGG